ncbi:hypothetical protein IM711_12660 [Microbacterium esteraromaticum]|uniref:hypothetical protein n=1 Tax=Microbacterium esteraromaticum TaxID=57043 RepID=UPI0015C91176
MSGAGPLAATTFMVAVGDIPEQLGTRAGFAALAGVAVDLDAPRQVFSEAVAPLC